MKRILIPLLLLLALSVSACQTATQAPTTPPVDLPTPKAPPMETVVQSPPPALETDTPPAMPPLDPLTSQPTVETMRQIHVQTPNRIQWNSSGSQFAVTTEQGLTVYDAGTLQPVHTLTVDSTRQLRSFAPDGLLAALLVGDQTVEIVSLETDEVVRTIRTETSYLNNIGLSPDGSWLITDVGDVIAVDLWDVASGEKVRSLSGFETAAPVYTVNFSADGSQLIWLSRATVQLQDVETGNLSPSVHHEDFIVALDLSRDGQLLVTSAGGTTQDGGFAPMVYLWETATGQQRGSFPLTEGNTSISLSPDGLTLAVAQANAIELWDIGIRQRVQVLEGHTDIVTLLAYSPDGQTLASAAGDNTVRLWLVQGPQL